MAHTLFSWDDTLIVPVVSVTKGKVKLLRKRRIHNAPLKYLCGRDWVERFGTADPVIVVEWRGKITAADINRPIMFMGREYDASWASGSMIKERKTFGFIKGLKPLGSSFTEVEQSTKVGRALLPDSSYAVAGAFTVKTVAKKEKFNGIWPEGDGFGYIPERLLPKGWLDTSITLGKCKQNYQLWQQLILAPNYQALLRQVLGWVDSWWQTDYQAVVDSGTVGMDDTRAALVNANHEMERHPYVVQKNPDSVAAFFRQVGTSPMLEQEMYLMVPAATWTLPPGEYMCSRFPITSTSGTAYVEIDSNDKVAESERERVGKLLGAVQVSLTGKDPDGNIVHAKCLLGVVPDDMWPEGGPDIVTSVENWKFGPKQTGLMILDGVMSVLSAFDSTRLLGADPDAYAIMTGDFDGDFTAVAKIPKELSELRYALANLPPISGKKTVKTHTLYGDRGAGDFLLNAMNANLGWATNNRSATMAATREQRRIIAQKCHEAGMISRPTEKELDIFLTTTVQQTVDALKSFIKTSVINGRMSRLNGILSDVLGGTPSYLRWKGSEWAWKAGRPRLWSQLSPELQYLAATNEDFRKGPEMKSHLRDETNGFIAEIFKHGSRPITDDGESLLQLAWEASGRTLEPLPLVHFRNWAPPVEEKDIEAAKKFQTAYDEWLESREIARSAGEYDATDLDNVAEWHAEFQNSCISIAKREFGGDIARAAYAYWHLAHSSGSKLSQAAGVFIGFQRIALAICRQASQRETPRTCETILVGMVHNFTSVPDSFEGEVDVLDGEVFSVSGHPRLKSTLVAVIGDISVKNADAGMVRPANGRYVCKALPFTSSGKTWRAVMTLVQERS